MISAQNKKLRYQTIFSNGKHEGISDTTEDKGGNNSGFRPHELLEASLASCMNMWLRMYADNHNISVSEVNSCVSIDRSHPDEVYFEYSIDISGGLSENDRLKLLSIASTCPVHKTLSKRIIIKRKEHNSVIY